MTCSAAAGSPGTPVPLPRFHHTSGDGQSPHEVLSWKPLSFSLVTFHSSFPHGRKWGDFEALISSLSLKVSSAPLEGGRQGLLRPLVSNPSRPGIVLERSTRKTEKAHQTPIKNKKQKESRGCK